MAVGFIRRVPVLGSLLSLPGISAVSKLSLKRDKMQIFLIHQKMISLSIGFLLQLDVFAVYYTEPTLPLFARIILFVCLRILLNLPEMQEDVSRGLTMLLSEALS